MVTMKTAGHPNTTSLFRTLSGSIGRKRRTLVIAAAALGVGASLTACSAGQPQTSVVSTVTSTGANQAGGSRPDQQGYGGDVAAAAGQQLQGTWIVTVTTTGEAPITQLVTFFADGTTLANANQRPAQQGQPGGKSFTSAGQGDWSKSGDRQFNSQFVQLIFDDGGSYKGMIKVHDTIRLDPSGETWAGSFSADVLDPSGKVVQSGKGTETATRSH
jgi:hypothetical protein